MGQRRPVLARRGPARRHRASEGELPYHLCSVRWARVAPLEQSLHQVFDVVGQAGDETTDARRRFEHHFGQHHHHVLAGERRFSGQTLEHDATEREDVDAGVDLPLPQRLFWRHITGFR